MLKSLRVTCLIAGLALVPALAHAQLPVYRPNANLAVGERYHVEVSIGLWNPSPDVTVSSDSLQVIGSQIDAVNDLGFAQKKLPEFSAVVRPATKHKFRFDYIPISYAADTVLTRTLTFHGATYTVGVPVTSSLDWKAYRFGYEYDLTYTDRGFFGIIGEVKYTSLSASVASEFASGTVEASAPVPSFGAIARVYPSRYVGITAELTGSKLPEKIIKNAHGHYVDFDLYSTVNLSNNVGAQVGYRSINADVHVDTDAGSLTLKGPYLRGVVRF